MHTYVYTYPYICSQINIYIYFNNSQNCSPTLYSNPIHVHVMFCLIV